MGDKYSSYEYQDLLGESSCKQRMNTKGGYYNNDVRNKSYIKIFFYLH